MGSKLFCAELLLGLSTETKLQRGESQLQMPIRLHVSLTSSGTLLHDMSGLIKPSQMFSRYTTVHTYMCVDRTSTEAHQLQKYL